MASSVFVWLGPAPTFPTPLDPASGGTGISSYAIGDLLYASGTTTLSKLADVATGSVLVSGGVGVAPAYSATPTVTSLTLGTGGTFESGGASGKAALTGTTPMLQLGGTTSSFPSLKRNGTSIDFRLADDNGYAGITGTNLRLKGGSVFLGSSDVTLLSTTAPTISSGFGSSPSVASNNGSVVILIDVGTGGTATSGVIGLPTAATGWTLQCVDITAAAAHTGLRTVQTASTTTSATIESQNSAGAATAWAASSIVRIIAMAY